MGGHQSKFTVTGVNGIPKYTLGLALMIRIKTQKVLDKWGKYFLNGYFLDSIDKSRI